MSVNPLAFCGFSLYTDDAGHKINQRDQISPTAPESPVQHRPRKVGLHMRICKDCYAKVRNFELYCPRCSADLYGKHRVQRTGLLENLAHFKGASR